LNPEHDRNSIPRDPQEERVGRTSERHPSGVAAVKPSPFEYHAPDTLAEASDLKCRHASEAAVLAGGQSLIPLMASRLRTPQVLIDVKRIPELRDARRDDGSLAIGAAVRQSRLHDDAALAGALGGILAEAARHIGHIETRHRGTVGGSLAHADPVAELPVVAVALEADIVVRGAAGGERRVPASEFFVGPRQTELQPDEILVEARFRAPAADLGVAFAEIARRHGDPAMATAIALLGVDEAGDVGTAAVTVGAVAGRPQRATAVEGALTGGRLTRERIAEASQAAAELVEPELGAPDPGPTPHPPEIPLAYRRRLATAVVAEALTKAFARVKGGHAT
jgi:carbon-monoxide dehydrogenase medium subunit